MAALTIVTSIFWSVLDEKDFFFKLWILIALISTLYSYYWDISQDWNLCNIESLQNIFKKNNQNGQQIIKITQNHIYDRKLYYFAMIINLMLRFSWILTIVYQKSLTQQNLDQKNWEVFKFFIYLFEVIRRFIWNFFRFEKEHIQQNIIPFQENQQNKEYNDIEQDQISNQYIDIELQFKEELIIKALLMSGGQF
ncbi:hypothetical protein PPERSA_02473 [Pseudocohnilembus persalinus]|uniref:EXS domain-containing protein n=1 Tax=Pseudocohnilembus persalinus TaxID=266149 RepID=A0A0V0QB15_PSEPJ|nr:hypothetical protein PPERSA_02473 [Pseudocohnilembus persalinus]|eukprot:KRW99361.1 hypothetical protein PPERSA_02473 [Pseudocohnilembus persalinus]